MAEGAALAVLPGEPHRRALDQQRPEGQRLGQRPVDRAVLGDRLASPLEQRLQLRVHLEAAGTRASPSATCARRSIGTPVSDRLLGSACARSRPTGRAARRARRASADRVLIICERLAELRVQILFDPRHVVLAQDARGSAASPCRACRSGGVLADLLVEQRLREARLVALVVAVAAVADEVDHDVVAEALAVRHAPAGRSGRPPRGRRRSRGRSAPGSSSRRRCSRASSASRPASAVKPIWLLTTTWMRAAGGVARQLRQVQRLGHDALAGEGRVAVDQQRHDGAPLLVAGARLLRAGPPFDDRIHRLEMRRVRREGEVDASRPSGSRGRSRSPCGT